MYEPDDLDEWLSEIAPQIKRKSPQGRQHVASHKHDPADTNPYLEHAKKNGFVPPLDVERALAEMAFGNIHATQVSVSASLLEAGREINEVVDIIMDATAGAAGDLGTRWNWARERARVRQMCNSWLAKHPRTAAAAAPRANPEPPTERPANVVNLATARKPKAEPKPVKQPKHSHHIMLGETLLDVIAARDERLMTTDQGAYWYRDGLWMLMNNAALDRMINTEVQAAAAELKIEITNRLRNETRNYLLWHKPLQQDNVDWDGHGLVPTRSGLVDPLSGAVTPPTPEQFVTWRIECGYDPGAGCPLWLQMLRDTFADREPDVRMQHMLLLQEIAGAGLLDHKPKALSRALVLVGGSNSGKSEVVRVLAGLFGETCITTPFDQLGTAHGLMPFAQRAPWVLHEAFDQSKWHMSSLVKALISGDTFQINIKNGPMLTRRFTAPILWATNSPPQFKEESAAMTNRMAVVTCKCEFDPERPVGVASQARAAGLSGPADLVLQLEMPGLLAWAVAGLRRALERGSFVLPDESVEASRAIRRDSNLAKPFMEECVEYAPNGMVSMPDFAAAFASWWLEHKGEDRSVPSSDSVGRALAALADPCVVTGLRASDRRQIAGIKLNAQGMRHWNNSVTSDAYIFAGRRASTTDASGNPNGVSPVTWDTKASVMAMRSAQKRAKEVSQVSAADTHDTSVTHLSGEASGAQLDDPPF